MLGEENLSLYKCDGQKYMKVSLLGMMSQAHWTDPVCYVTCNVTINKVLGSQEQEFYYNIYGPYTSFYFWLVTVIHCKTQML